MTGTSPRTRGKLIAAPVPERLDRNIPAHAGKTHYRKPTPNAQEEHPRARGENPYLGGEETAREEHPRARGENAMEAKALSNLGGTSPRTRGKLNRALTDATQNRNIPAHAGKTTGRGRHFRRCREHPRARGENGVLTRRKSP